MEHAERIEEFHDWSDMTGLALGDLLAAYSDPAGFQRAIQRAVEAHD